MFPDWLTVDLTPPAMGLEEHLAAARDLVAPAVLDECGAAEEIRQCAELGYNHFWMNTLQLVGLWLEDGGRDSELPSEFWVHVAAAAQLMEFPEFVPYCLGKAQGWPGQDPGDFVAAFSTLPVVTDMDDELRELCNRAASVIREDDPAVGEWLDTANIEALAEHLRNGAFDRNGARFSELLSTGFDDAFALVVSKDFPAEHAKHAWAVIGANTFRVVLGEGLLPTTHAEVWWRAG